MTTHILELNKAYAHVISHSFQQAAEDMVEHFTNMGFNKEEARQFIQPSGGDSHPTLPFPVNTILGKKADVDVIALKESLNEDEKKQVEISSDPEGNVKVEVSGNIGEALKEKILKVTPTEERLRVKNILDHRVEGQEHVISPSELEISFEMPKLCYVNEQLAITFPIDSRESVVAEVPWILIATNGIFAPGEFRYDSQTQVFEFDIDASNKLTYRVLDPQEQAQLFFQPLLSWTQNDFCVWLCDKLAKPDLLPSELLDFVRSGINSLIGQAIELSVLNLAKYALVRAFEGKINRAREVALQRGYQLMLFEDSEHIQTRFDYAFRFDKSTYPANRSCYSGSYLFSKHFYPTIAELDRSGEEYLCAVAIDQAPEIEFWMRNPANWEGSFKLPLKSGHHFYPDFVGKLKDGRTFAIEYKGAHLATGEDAQNKELIGKLWAKQSNNQALFLMATARDEHGRDVAQQVRSMVD